MLDFGPSVEIENLFNCVFRLIRISAIYRFIPSGTGDQFGERLLPGVHFYHLDAADDLAH